VRELIPEFYSLPEFLSNANGFDYGRTQQGDVVHDVRLPPWAQNDPREFVRILRKALESPIVTDMLPSWIDLVFGFKQRGKAAEAAQNLFMYLTYEGQVDIEKIDDPLERRATLLQIQNFGQTPSRLFKKPHKPRGAHTLMSRISFENGKQLDPQTREMDRILAPPLCVPGLAGAFCVYLLPTGGGGGGGVGGGTAAPARSLYAGAVGDANLHKDRICAVGDKCLLLPVSKSGKLHYVRWGFDDGGVRLYAYRLREARQGDAPVVDVPEASYSGLHQGVVTCASCTKNGVSLITGGTDAVVRLWTLEEGKKGGLFLKAAGRMSGHESTVLCVSVVEDLSLCVSGSKDASVILWDLNTHEYIRELTGHSGPVGHVSVNEASGNIVTLSGSEMRMWSINGECLAATTTSAFTNGMLSPPTCLCSTDCEIWQDGVSFVTGHSKGVVIFVPFLPKCRMHVF
jgi:hypothetical protein